MQVMNFNQIFDRNDISAIQNQIYQLNERNNNRNTAVTYDEDQAARMKQRELHKRMDEIKKKWFPQRYRQDKLKKKAERRAMNLGLRHIPDAVAKEKQEQTHKAVIAKVCIYFISHKLW